MAEFDGRGSSKGKKPETASPWIIRQFNHENTKWKSLRLSKILMTLVHKTWRGKEQSTMGDCSSEDQAVSRDAEWQKVLFINDQGDW